MTKINSMSYRVVFIGAGNLATRLSVELNKRDFVIEQIYSRTADSAARLANRFKSYFTTSPWKIMPNADIYFVALKDSAWEDVLPHASFGNSLVIHCSGSMPLHALKKYAKNTGVLYPLQTFSKKSAISLKQVPVFIEANSKKNERMLFEVAESISNKVEVMNSENRLYLHISAVFACNFVNHFYAIAADILEKRGIPFDVLRPLIKETAKKIKNTPPVKAQTGPAVRFDQNVISSHLKALQPFPEYQETYKEVSESIYHFQKNR